MDKQQILSFVKEKVSEGVITFSDLENLSKTKNTPLHTETSRMIYVLYGIGALIALVGIIVLISNYWQEIGFVGRFGVTFGIALVAYNSALFMRNEHYRVLSQIFFGLSAILAPIGIIIMFRDFNREFNLMTQLVTATALTLIFFWAYLYTRRDTLILIFLMFAGWANFALIDFLFPVTSRIGTWSICVLGLVYAICAYYIGQKGIAVNSGTLELKTVENILYITGTSMTLGALLAVGGIFDLLIIAPLFGVFYFSLYIKSKIMLALSALFLVIYIFKITNKYFADSFGWPLSLIVIGFLIIGISYFSIYLSQKYIGNKSIRV